MWEVTKPRARVEPLRWDQSPGEHVGRLSAGRKGTQPRTRPPAPDLGCRAPGTGLRTAGPLHPSGSVVYGPSAVLGAAGAETALPSLSLTVLSSGAERGARSQDPLAQ